MVDADDGPPLEARPPGVADLVSLCRSLNREGARYIVIGGMAIIQAGFVRATEDIDRRGHRTIAPSDAPSQRRTLAPSHRVPYRVPVVLAGLNVSHVPASGCCSTPGFDQSQTPPGKIRRNRAISSAVNVTL